MFPETKHRIISTGQTEDGRDQVRISIDQLTYYPEAMGPFLHTVHDSHPLHESLISMELPRDMNIVPFPKVTVVGDGYGRLEVYTLGILDKASSGLDFWRHFATDGFITRKGDYDPRALGTGQEREKLGRLFSTGFHPFLNNPDWKDGRRIFNIHVDQSTILQVRVDVGEDSADDKLTILYVADNRSWEPFEITTLTRVNGYWNFSKPTVSSVSARR
jgi:hypothetical protein